MEEAVRAEIDLEQGGIGRRALLAGVAVAGVLGGARRTFAEDGNWLCDSDDLGPLPVRTSDALPLSDQANHGEWIVDPTLTDEFDGGMLDSTKWHPTNPEWSGRIPGAFSENDVSVEDGQLRLRLCKGDVPKSLERRGYKGWTSGAVQSRGRARYGYFEVRSKPMKSRAASTFWLYAADQNQWTEIDVYEVWPGAASRERMYSTNLHVFDMPGGKPDHAFLGLWTTPFDIADDYHVYGLEWGPEYLMWFVDGVPIRRHINTKWHQALTVNLDIEIMANLTGIPNAPEAADVYSVDYVRSFKTARWQID